MEASEGRGRAARPLPIGAGHLGHAGMWQEILTAFALYLIIEGMIPFIGPQAFRRTVERIGSLSDNNLRLAGLAAMGAGLLLLFIVRA
ncbi:MAG TPA: DUF2065 family protein [Woeseiaceae bacterium]